MQDACEEILLKNTSYWEADPSTNGSMVPSLEMGNTLCLGLCSGHGRCVNATCVCDGNFTSADCSIDKNKGPVVMSIPGNGLCDARNRSDCHLIRISGKDFIDSEQLTCLSIEVKINPTEFLYIILCTKTLYLVKTIITTSDRPKFIST